MTIKNDKTKASRIKKEKDRLVGIYKDVPEEQQSIIDGLINRAAFMRVTLEDMEKDLDTNGFTEPFTQSERVEPYDRERPVARLYNTMNKNYQSIIKQMTDLVPKQTKPVDVLDPFNDFVDSREDV